jgi:hypothetical protein
MEGSGRGLIWGTFPKFSLRDGGKPRERSRNADHSTGLAVMCWDSNDTDYIIIGPWYLNMYY